MQKELPSYAKIIAFCSDYNANYVKAINQTNTQESVYNCKLEVIRYAKIHTKASTDKIP